MEPRKYTNLGRITTQFGGKTRGEFFHPGIDVANAPGTPIPALNDGQVIEAGAKNDGFGNRVKIKDVNGDIHQYGHLQNFNVKPGMNVKRGQPIAKMGKTGNSYSPSGGDPTHLDIRIVSAYGKYKNPLTYLNSFK